MIVVNRETALCEKARNKERDQILSAAAAPDAEGRQGRSAMDALSNHSEIVIVLFYLMYEFKWTWTALEIFKKWKNTNKNNYIFFCH